MAICPVQRASQRQELLESQQLAGPLSVSKITLVLF
jgi:hypothetical protein